jgi:hypothetical protein
MTNELEYYGRPEPRTHSVVRQQPKPIQLPPGDKPARDEHFYQLFEGDAVRLAKARGGLRAGASFLGLAVHSGRTSLNGRTCFPKVPTAAQLTGQSTRATSGHFRGLDDDGFIKIQHRKRASSMYTVAYTDSSKERYAQISKPWLEVHRGVGASALFLLAVLLAMAGPRRTFTRRLDDLLAALDVSRATFYRLAGILKRRGWLSWHCADGSIELTMLEIPVSKTAVLPVSKTAVLGVSKTAHEVAKDFEVARSSEEARSKPRSTPEARRAKTCACEPTLRPNFSRSRAEAPPTPPWSKATSGPRRVILNGRLHELHEVIRNALGLRDLDRGILRRINGMLCRMPYRTLDEFRDAMTDAVEGLREQRDIWPNSAFYRDDEKAVLWAVGQATGCSLWNVCNGSVDEAQRACRVVQSEGLKTLADSPSADPPKIAAVNGAWLHAHLCDKGMIELDGELLLCPQCAARAPVEEHGCERGWRTTVRSSGDVDVWPCPHCRAREHGCVGGEWSGTEDRAVVSLDANGRLVREPCRQCADEREAETRRREMEPQDAVFDEAHMHFEPCRPAAEAA